MDTRIGGLGSGLGSGLVNGLGTPVALHIPPDPGRSGRGSRFAGAWGSGSHESPDDDQQGKGFGRIADGGSDAEPGDDDYLTAPYEQYEGSALAPEVHTFAMAPAEGVRLDVRA